MSAAGQTSFDSAQCTASGGTIERRGLLGSPTCVRRLSDAGQSCRSEKDCKGKCLVAPGQRSIALPLGSPVKGICQAEEPLFGCFAEVEHRKLATRRLCVD